MERRRWFVYDWRMLRSPAGIILHFLAALLVGAGAGYATAQGWIPWVLAVAIGAVAGASVGLTIARVRRARLAAAPGGGREDH